MLAVIAYNALSNACEKAQDAKRAFQTIHAMQQQGLMLDVMAYNAFGRACENAQDAKRAFQTVHAKQQQRLMLDVIAYNALSRNRAKGEGPGCDAS